MTQYHQKKIAMINDLSGYGRCSITAALPELSGTEDPVLSGYPLLCAVQSLSFPVYFFDDYTDKMEPCC